VASKLPIAPSVKKCGDEQAHIGVKFGKKVERTS